MRITTRRSSKPSTRPRSTSVAARSGSRRKFDSSHKPEHCTETLQAHRKEIGRLRAENAALKEQVRVLREAVTGVLHFPEWPSSAEWQMLIQALAATEGR